MILEAYQTEVMSAGTVSGGNGRWVKLEWARLALRFVIGPRGRAPAVCNTYVRCNIVYCIIVERGARGGLLNTTQAVEACE